jgi:hypothetical protein
MRDSRSQKRRSPPSSHHPRRVRDAPRARGDTVRSWTNRTGNDEPGGERARRDAGRWAAHDRDGGRGSGRCVRRPTSWRDRGQACAVDRQRHRQWHGRNHARTSLRAILHHQAGGQREPVAVVYGIVKQSGGSIWVYSERGKGSTLKIFLPAATAVAEPATPPVDIQALRGTETVLVVEDQMDVRGVIERTLSRYGYTVVAGCQWSRGARDGAKIPRHHPRDAD